MSYSAGTIGAERTLGYPRTEIWIVFGAESHAGVSGTNETSVMSSAPKIGRSGYLPGAESETGTVSGAEKGRHGLWMSPEF